MEPMWLCREGHSWQREQQVQRPWARSALGEPTEELLWLACSEWQKGVGDGQQVPRKGGRRRWVAVLNVAGNLG